MLHITNLQVLVKTRKRVQLQTHQHRNGRTDHPATVWSLPKNIVSVPRNRLYLQKVFKRYIPKHAALYYLTLFSLCDGPQ